MNRIGIAPLPLLLLIAVAFVTARSEHGNAAHGDAHDVSSGDAQTLPLRSFSYSYFTDVAAPAPHRLLKQQLKTSFRPNIKFDIDPSLQDPTTYPTSNLTVHAVGLHWSAPHLGDQMPVHHFCGRHAEPESQLNSKGADIMQCALYSDDGPYARLIGIEYLISEKLFLSLPMKERVLWHSHGAEVATGGIVLPGLPIEQQAPLLLEIAKMYGKTITTWPHGHIVDNFLPTGVPKLSQSFMSPDQIRPESIALLDSLPGVGSTVEQRKSFFANSEIGASIWNSSVVYGADSWARGPIQGSAIQLTTTIIPAGVDKKLLARPMFPTRQPDVI